MIGQRLLDVLLKSALKQYGVCIIFSQNGLRRHIIGRRIDQPPNSLAHSRQHLARLLPL